MQAAAIRLIARGFLLSVVTWLLFPACVRADAGSAAGATAEFEAAQRAARYAMGQLVTVRQMAMKVATARPEYVAAADLVKQTHDAYLASQKGTVADLSQSNAKYKDLLKQREAAEAELEKMRKEGASPESFGEVATRKLNITRQIRELEDSAGKQAGSPELKKKWQDACQALEVLEIKLIAECEKTPQVAEARKAAEDADAALRQAGSQMVSARAAYSESRRQEMKAEFDQRRQEVFNWSSSHYYGPVY